MSDTSGLNAGAGAAAGIQAISSIGNAISQSNATRAKAAYQKQQYATNVMLANMAAADAKARGEAKAQGIAKNTDQEIGAERAQQGAQGIDINSGTAREIQLETQAAGQHDILTTQNNAWREAWGHQMEAINTVGTGRMLDMASNQEANNTLLTGGMQGLSYGASAYYNMNNSNRKATT